MNDQERGIVGALEVLPVESVEFGRAFRGYLERYRQWRDESMDGVLAPFIMATTDIMRDRFGNHEAFRGLVDAVGPCEVLEVVDAKRLDFAIEDNEEFGDVLDLSIELLAAEIAEAHCKTCEPCRQRIAAWAEIEANVRVVESLSDAARPTPTGS